MSYIGVSGVPDALFCDLRIFTYLFWVEIGIFKWKDCVTFIHIFE